MKYLDITQTITSGMKKYPSDPDIKIRGFKSLKNGNSCNLQTVFFGSHTGTHVDAPRHIFNRELTVDNIKIDNLICGVVITDTTCFLKKGFFKNIRRKDARGILFKDSRCKTWLSMKKAMLLVQNGLKIIGTEKMSIERSSDKSHPVHRLLLSNGIIIIEGLCLKKAKLGYGKLICLPLKIKNGDGAPARAVLVYD